MWRDHDVCFAKDTTLFFDRRSRAPDMIPRNNLPAGGLKAGSEGRIMMAHVEEPSPGCVAPTIQKQNALHAAESFVTAISIHRRRETLQVPQLLSARHVSGHQTVAAP